MSFCVCKKLRRNCSVCPNKGFRGKRTISVFSEQEEKGVGLAMKTTTKGKRKYLVLTVGGQPGMKDKYETIVFRIMDFNRYDTAKEAEAGHYAMSKKWNMRKEK